MPRARSKYLKDHAASVPAHRKNTRPENISNEDPATGVKERFESSFIVGVVHSVFPMIIFSSVFPVPPAPLSMIRIRNHVPFIPLEARRLRGIVAPSVTEGTIVLNVAPAAIVPRGPALGINTVFAPAPNVPASPGDHINEGPSLTVLYIFTTVFDTNWNAPRYLSSLFCSSHAIDPHATLAFNCGAMILQSGLSSISLKSDRAINRKLKFRSYVCLPRHTIYTVCLIGCCDTSLKIRKCYECRESC